MRKIIIALISLSVTLFANTSFALDPSILLTTCNVFTNGNLKSVRVGIPLTKCGTTTAPYFVMGKTCTNSFYQSQIGGVVLYGQGRFTYDGFTNYSVNDLFLVLSQSSTPLTNQSASSVQTIINATGIKINSNPFTLSASYLTVSGNTYQSSTTGCTGQLAYPISRKP